MPTGGGLAIFCGFFLASLIVDFSALPLFLGGFVIMITGLIDDHKGLSPAWKFAGQFLAVIIYVSFGPRIEFITNPFGGMLYLGALAVPLTVLWMVSVINVMNFIDGLDGLATGIATISALALFSIAFDFGRMDAALVSILVVGCAAGFLPFNFNPAKVYLGDAGAMFLGFLLAAIATEGALKGAATIGLTVPILILAVPVGDAFFAIVRRLQQGVPVYEADRSHFHHRLLDLGYSQRQVAFCAYFLSFASSGAALIIARSTQGAFWFVLGIATIFVWGALRVGMIKPVSVKSHRRVL